MLKQLPKILARILVVVCCLTAGCSSTSTNAPSVTTAGLLPSPTLDNKQPIGPQHVTLLLPLSGGFGGSAQAVRNGFLAAYYYHKQNNPNNAPTIAVVDSANGNIQNLYAQAIHNGANLIVGPLTKPQLQALASGGNIAVPTLALNTLDNNQSSPSNLYQFGLSPRDEAVQVADKAHQDGHHSAIIIAPATAWGQGIANAFSNRWQSSGGEVAGSLAFTSSQELSTDMAKLLHVDKSVISSKGFKAALKNKIPLASLRRQDFDVVFLVASPQQARLIKPLLKFYFAGSVPVYATSSIYSGRPAPQYDRDLDGIIFCDMPWVLNNGSRLSASDSAIQARVMSLWPSSYANNIKLYAFGVDAYNLINNLNRLSSGMPGATGYLYLGPDHQINRRLLWAQMRNGVAVIM